MGDYLPVVLEQSHASLGSAPYAITWAATPTSGSVLLVAVARRDGNGACSVLTSGWAVIAENVGGGSFDDTMVVFGKVSDGTESGVTVTIPSNPSAGMSWIVFEVPNVALPAAGTNTTTSSGTSMTAGSVSTTGAGVIIGAWAQQTGTGAYSASGAWTELDEQTPIDSHPSGVVVYQEVLAATTANPAATSSASDWYRAVAIALDALPPAATEPGVVLDPIGEIDSDPIPIEGDIASWVIRRGSGAEVTGAAEPGSATVRLRNTGDLYNPENSSSALIDYLRDGTSIWLGINNDGLLTGSDTRGLFGGRITDITVLPMAGPDDAPFVEFQCEDALGWYGRTPVYVAYQAGRSHGALRQNILNAIGETRYTLAHEIMTMPLSGAEGNALTVLDNINRANGTRHFIKPEDDGNNWYRYTTYNRQHGLDGAADATLAGTDIRAASGVSWRLAVDTVTNAQRAVVTPVRFTPNTYTVWEADTLPIIVTPSRPYTVWVEFDDYVQGATLDVTRTGDSPTTETLEEFGTRAKITLAQTGVGDATTYTGLTVQGSLARRLPDESWLANDTTSQLPPRGIRQGTDIRGEYVGTLAGARGIAEHVVWRYGNPQTRPTLSVVNWFPEMFDIDLGDIISVTFAEVSATSQLFEVVGLTHTGHFITPTRSMHQTDYVLQKCRVQSDPGWFILDTSELDSADILAY